MDVMGRALTRAALALCLLAWLSLAHAQVMAAAAPDAPAYKVRVDYIITAATAKQVFLRSGESKAVRAPPAPPGYELKYLEVSCCGGFPQGLKPVCDKLVVEEGEVLSAVSYNGTVCIVNEDAGNVTVELVIKSTYVKRVWAEVRNCTVAVEVEKPEAPFTLSNLTVKVTVDNFLPLRVKDVRGPDGSSLLSPDRQDELDPEAVAVDLKHVQIRPALGPGEGTYTVEFEVGEEYVLPSAFLVAGGRFENGTVPPGGFGTFSSPPAEGWQLLGYVVVLYSVAPERGYGGPKAYVEAPLLDYVYSGQDSIEIGAVSYLVPPIRLNVWIKGYVVFGSWFKVVNPSPDQVNVLYAPISLKGAGAWSEGGVEVRALEEELSFATYAYVVVQVPSYGAIVDVKTPSGSSVGAYVNTKWAWEGGVRAISALEDEAYVQVKSGRKGEYGVYKFEIEWEPIEFKVVDSKGRGMANAEVRLAGPVNITGLTDASGVARVAVYCPGIYNVTVVFKGCEVYSGRLIPYESCALTLPCAVYDLGVRVVGFWNQPLPGSQVVVRDGSGAFVDSNSTSSSGCATFTQLPKGVYDVSVSYKRVDKAVKVVLDDNKVVDVKLDVVIEIPFLGVPLSASETLGIAVAIGGLLALSKALGRRREEGEEVIEE
ncbi:MAG: hypothetical protein DRJ56_01815 [Thermoprotei archaeon]|nr:MAG: hypothetical protein DRJ56_01815 [Thermoprotei archaeon]